MLVKIHNSNFRYKGKVYYENSTVDLPKSEVDKFPKILIPVADVSDNNAADSQSSEVRKEVASAPQKKRKSRSSNKSRN